MSNTSSVAHNYEKIQRASVMEADIILFKNIAQLIEYRKEIAIAIIRCNDKEMDKNLRTIYEWSEFRLKKVLGL